MLLPVCRASDPEIKSAAREQINEGRLQLQAAFLLFLFDSILFREQ